MHATTIPNSAMVPIPTPAAMCIMKIILSRGSLVLTRAELPSVVVERGLFLVVVLTSTSELVEGSVPVVLIVLFSAAVVAVKRTLLIVGSSDVADSVKKTIE